MATSTSDLTSIKKTAKKYGVIGIDEGQFVSANGCSVGSITSHLFLSSQFPDIVEFCEDMANEGKTIIVAALDGTFQRKVHTRLLLFYNIVNLVVRPQDPPAMKMSDLVCQTIFFLRLWGMDTRLYNIHYTDIHTHTSTALRLHP